MCNEERPRYKKAQPPNAFLLSTRITNISSFTNNKSNQQPTTTTMKYLGVLISLFIAATAAPAQVQNQNQETSVEMTGRQLEPLIDVLRVHNLGNTLIADPTITCDVAYTLTLSMLSHFQVFCALQFYRGRVANGSLGAGPPYTIELATLDLGNCTYTTTP